MSAVVDGKSLLIDKARTTLLGTDHPKCPDGRHLRFEQGRWTIVTADGRPAPDIAFEYVQLVCAAPSVVKRDGKWGFISIDGKLVASRYFEHVNAFHDGIAAVSDAGLWGVIGEDGSYLLGPLRLARGMFVSGAGVYSIEFEEGLQDARQGAGRPAGPGPGGPDPPSAAAAALVGRRRGTVRR